MCTLEFEDIGLWDNQVYHLSLHPNNQLPDDKTISFIYLSDTNFWVLLRLIFNCSYLLEEQKCFQKPFLLLVMCFPDAIKEKAYFGIKSRKAASGFKDLINLKYFFSESLSCVYKGDKKNALKHYFPWINRKDLYDGKLWTYKMKIKQISGT